MIHVTNMSRMNRENKEYIAAEGEMNAVVFWVQY